MITPLGFIVMLICIPVLIALYGPKNSGSRRARTDEEMDAMLKEMVGKSKKECRKIVKKYRP